MVAKTRRKVASSEDEARLRAESPAYSDADEWEMLAPQAMSVVLSVRMGARVARELTRIAARADQTPSALIREWTLQRLAGAEEASGVRAVREAQTTYDVAEEFEGLRDRYRPGEIKLLLLGESRPAGGTFFYKADSHLFFATREAWVRAYGSAPFGVEFLSELQRNGVWLYDLAAAPVNRMPGRPRREAVMAQTADLVRLLRATEPPRVVAIKRSLEPVARSAMLAGGMDLGCLRVLPFPLYQWREEYLRELAGVFASLSSGALGGTRPASSAGSGDSTFVTQPITPNDLSAGQIRIPQASKQLLPHQKGPLTVVVRGERVATMYDPRNGPDRPRSGVVRIPRATLRGLVQPYERLAIEVQGNVVGLV
jgi:hypothetical protein